ncbi:alpha/beta hydrolase [Streptomyces sioyaensis]|uniref:alpha/beta hydrolase n=1 Tax=Streptomyces sioyaensis TaxID=67364 RepID=UPI001F15E551|nr:alpha/beta hydrolase [Streptomyces sioyaensis]
MALAVVAATVPLAASATASTAPGDAALSAYFDQRLDWRSCDDGGAAECADVEVPLDYSRPDGKTIRIAVSRIKAGEPSERHGVLLMNPGGPGGSGLTLPATMLKKGVIPDSVRRRFDLIGFDPRGVGRSAPVNCGLTKQELSLNGPVYRPETFDKDVSRARTMAQKCQDKNSGVLPHITTRNTARDMDVIRGALGERKISYLGVSYGTYLGAVFTQMFPERADRFVLDSALDPGRVWRGFSQDRAQDAERAFTRWTQWTAERHATYGLGDTPDKVRERFWALFNRPAPNPVHDFVSGSPSVFYDVKEAAKSIAGLDTAAGPTGLAPATGSSGEPAAGPSAASGATDNLYSAYWSVMCADSDSWPRDPEQYRRDAALDKQNNPLSEGSASNINACAFWPKATEPTTVVDNTASALIVNNEWDSQTPLAGATGLHKAMKGSRMVTVQDGVGHGVYGTNPCAGDAVNTYLTTGRLPEKNLNCRSTG